MEIAAKRTFVLAGVLALFGIVALIQPRIKQDWKPESWVEDNLPTTVGKFRMVPSHDDPRISYRASKFDYEALEPFGIVARLFSDGDRTYDSVAVVGNNRNSFHDPNFCMAGQYYNITGEHIVQLKTQRCGVVPISVMSAQDNEGARLVAFCYLGPKGFRPTQGQLYSDWFWAEITLGKPEVGAFYRFMTTSSEDTEANLLSFASEYLDSAQETSQGKL